MDVNRYKWVLLALLFLVGAINYADRTAFSAVLPLVKQDLGLSDAVLGAVGGLFLWSYGCVSPLAGLAGDRFARTSMIVWSLVAWSVVTGITGMVRNGNELLTMRVFLGFAEALYIPSALALIADYHRSETRAKAMAIHIMGLQAGFVLGGTLAGFLGDRFGWRASLLALAAAGLTVASLAKILFSRRIRPEPVREVKESVEKPSLREALATLAQTPSFLFLIVDSMLLSVGNWVFAYWLPLFFKETFHMSLTSSGLFGTLAMSGGAWAGILSGGWLSDRVIARRGVRSRMLLQVFCYLAATPFLLSFVWSHDARLVTLSVFLFNCFANMGISNNNPLVCDLLAPKLWSTSFGVANLVNCVMGGSGIFFAGFFKQELGLRLVFAGVSGLVLISAALLLVGYFVFLDSDLKRRKAAQAAAA